MDPKLVKLFLVCSFHAVLIYLLLHFKYSQKFVYLKNFFVNEDYTRIFSEISEEPYWYREYGYLSSKKFGNYILFFDFAKYSKYDDGGDIEIIKSFNHDEKIDVVDLVINHYRKLA